MKASRNHRHASLHIGSYQTLHTSRLENGNAHSCHRNDDLQYVARRVWADARSAHLGQQRLVLAYENDGGQGGYGSRERDYIPHSTSYMQKPVHFFGHC